MDSATGHNANVTKKKGSLKNDPRKLAALVVGAVIVLALIVLSGLYLNKASTASTIDGNKFQAVFFTNGQVYFGKLGQVNANYFKLTDVFYIQAADSATSNTDSKNPQSTAAQSTDIKLIKLGSEVHGPDDEMIISKDQVLFFENLKKDGKVSDSITKYNAQKK